MACWKRHKCQCMRGIKYLTTYYTGFFLVLYSSLLDWLKKLKSSTVLWIEVHWAVSVSTWSAKKVVLASLWMGCTCPLAEPRMKIIPSAQNVLFSSGFFQLLLWLFESIKVFLKFWMWRAAGRVHFGSIWKMLRLLQCYRCLPGS